MNDLASTHSSQKHYGGIPKIDSLHSINTKIDDKDTTKPKLDALNQVSVSCGVVDMTKMINKTPQNEEIYKQPSQMQT